MAEQHEERGGMRPNAVVIDLHAADSALSRDTESPASREEDPIEEMLARRHTERSKLGGKRNEQDIHSLHTAAATAFAKIKWRDASSHANQPGGDAPSHSKTLKPMRQHAESTTAVPSEAHTKSWTSGQSQEADRDRARGLWGVNGGLWHDAHCCDQVCCD